MKEDVVYWLVETFSEVALAASGVNLAPSFGASDPPELQKAYNSASATLQNDPGNVEARFMRGVVCQGKGWHEQAATDFVEVLRIQPGNARAWLYLSEVLTNLGRYDQSRAAREQALALSTASPATSPYP